MTTRQKIYFGIIGVASYGLCVFLIYLSVVLNNVLPVLCGFLVLLGCLFWIRKTKEE